MDIPESEADWRFAAVGRVKGDQRLWDAEVKDGSLLWQATLTPNAELGMVSFPTPHPAALAFNLAFEAARASTAMWSKVSFEGRKGRVSIARSSIPALFAYFEQAMAAAVFSFQVIEVYSNQTIARLAKFPMTVSRRKVEVTLSPAELERQLSTDEKMTVVLPHLVSAKSLKKTPVWASYRELKEIRDSTVHLKSIDQYVRNQIDKSSLYHRLLNQSPTTFPRTAISVIKHFSSPVPDRWVEAADVRLARIRKP